MNARLSLTLISCAVLAACASTKPVQLPKLDVPTTWLATIATTESSGNAPWDTLLNQPDLAALIKLSDDSNPSLRAAAARVAAAQAIYGMQNSARFPVVGAELGGSRGKQPVGGSSNQIVESANLTAPMSWEIDLWGRIADTSAAAKQDYLSSEEVYRAARVSLNSQVAQTWLRLLNLDDQLKIADSTVTAQTASLDLVVKRFKGGEASMVDVSQAKATLGLVNASRADIDRSRAQTQNALSVLLGKPPYVIERKVVAQSLPRASALPAGLPADVLNNRPDVRAAVRTLQATQLKVSAAEKAWLPSINLTGVLGWASSDLSKLVSTGSEAWGVGGVINLPIFNGGRLSSQLDLSKAQQREAAENYSAVVLQALREVEDALVGYRTYWDQSDALISRVDANAERLRLADLRYRSGATDYFEVLNAQQDLFQSQLELSNVKTSRDNSLIQLYAALGGGAVGKAAVPTLSQQ